MRLHEAATAADPTRARRAGRCRFAEPGLGERQRQIELADTTRAVQQQRMRLLLQRTLQRRRQPGQWQGAVAAYHGCASTAARTCCQTASRGAPESMRTKRAGACCMRAR